MMAQRIWDFVINTPTKWPSYAILAGIACLIVLGIVFCMIRNASYGKMLLSAGLCMGILTLLLCAGNLGLPVLMDPARCSIYYTYLLAAALSILIDPYGLRPHFFEGALFQVFFDQQNLFFHRSAS